MGSAKVFGVFKFPFCKVPGVALSIKHCPGEEWELNAFLETKRGKMFWKIPPYYYSCIPSRVYQNELEA